MSDERMRKDLPSKNKTKLEQTKTKKTTKNKEDCYRIVKWKRRVKNLNLNVGLKLNIQKTKIMTSGPIMANRSGNSERLYFPGLQNHCR